MIDIRNYSKNASITPASYVKSNNNAQKVQDLVRYLHDMQPVMEKEFNDLQELSKTYDNNIFPIKMAALAEVFKASETLYEWYIEKAKTPVS